MLISQQRSVARSMSTAISFPFYFTYLSWYKRARATRWSVARSIGFNKTTKWWQWSTTCWNNVYNNNNIKFWLIIYDYKTISKLTIIVQIIFGLWKINAHDWEKGWTDTTTLDEHDHCYYVMGPKLMKNDLPKQIWNNGKMSAKTLLMRARRLQNEYLTI